MNEIRLIEEGNDGDFGPTEFVPREPRTEAEKLHHARAKELQAKLRAQATARFVRLADDLADAFPTPEAVDNALRRVLQQDRNAA